MLLALLFVLGPQCLTAATARYRTMWRDDPATTMVVSWDQVSGGDAQIVYDLTDHGDNIAGYRFRQRPDRVSAGKGMKNCFARLSGLLPNTVYYFKIIDSEGASRRFSFQTAPSDPRVRLSIIAGGDSRNHREARRDANKIVGKLRPHVVMFGGDMTADDSPGEWREWLDDWQLTVGSDGRIFPILVARGNHEADNQVLIDLFDVPSSDVFYALNLGGSLLRIYTLNSMIPSDGPQRTWLEQDLRSSGRMTWKFAQYHHPMLPHTSVKPERPELVRHWGGLFYEYGVNLGVECDAHVVKTTWPIRPFTGIGASQGFVRDDTRGTVFIGEGCWGAPLRSNDDDKPWTRSSGRFNQFSWIFVDQSRVEIRVVKTDGADRVGEVSASNIFAIPYGLVIWSPPTGDVVTLYNSQGALATGAGQPTPPPAQARPTSGPVITRPGGAAAIAPAAAAVLRPDGKGDVRVGYHLRQRSNVEIILINSEMRELSRATFTGEGPGSMSKSINFARLSAGQYQLIVKADGQLLTRYQLVR